MATTVQSVGLNPLVIREELQPGFKVALKKYKGLNPLVIREELQPEESVSAGAPAS